MVIERDGSTCRALRRLSAVLWRLAWRASLIASPLAAAAQGAVPADTIAEARRLRDAHEYAAAASILAAYTEAHPDDIGTARLAALMAYWSKDFTSARSIYERTLLRAPNDADLRVEAARFLAEVGHRRRARDVLAPIVATGPRELHATRQAIALQGTLDYWDGDLLRARALFVDALRLDSTSADARRQLREIELAAASWVAVGATISHDDQPIDRVVPDAELGWFANQVTPLRVRFASTRFSNDDVSETVSVAEGAVSTFLAPARLDVALAAGILGRSYGEKSDWTGRAALGFRLPGHLAVEGSYQRAPYNNTAASLTKVVMAQEIAGTFRLRESRGWLGEASVRRESFDDDNAITTAYVWTLAPVARRQHGQVHLGYSFVAQSARESRFVARPDEVSVPPGQAPQTVRGYYDPYYTPRNLRAHSVLAAVKLVPGERWSITANSALGVAASDDAPVVFTTPARPPDVDLARTYYRRSFTPWKLDGAFEGKVSDAVRLALIAAHSNGAFYAETSAGVRVTYTFVAAARRRADRY